MISNPEPSVFSFAELNSIHVNREYERDDLEERLPTSLEGVAEPVQYLLAHIYRHSEKALPDWRNLDLSPQVRTEWERTELTRDPELSTSNFAFLVEGLDWENSKTPLSLLRRMTHSGDRSVQEEAIGTWDRCLICCRTTLEESRKALLILLGSKHDEIVYQVLLEFQKAHYYLTPPPLTRLLPLLEKPDWLAIEALRATEREAPREIWLEFLDSQRSPHLKLESIKLLGLTASEKDLEAVLRCVSTDPIFFGEGLLQFLLSLRRNDIDLTVVGMERILELLSSGISSGCTTELISGRWEQWLAVVREIDILSPIWPDVIQVLQGAEHRSATEYLVQLLRSRSLPHCQAQLIRSLTSLKVKSVELQVIGLFDEYPDACLQYIERLGGALSYEYLDRQLSLPQPEVAVSRSRMLDAVSAMGLELKPDLWSIQVFEWTPEMLQRANAGEIPNDVLLEIADHASGAISDRAIRLLGQSSSVEALTSLLSSVSENVIEEASRAIRLIGEKWYEQGRKQPEVLSRVRGKVEAGEALLADRLMTRIDSSTELVEIRNLFQRLALLRHPDQRSLLLNWRDCSDAEIRKSALQCEAMNHPAPHAFWAVSRLKSKDIRDVRWALESLKTRGETWCSTAVSECLDHPNMNIKKTAAETLAELGDHRTIEALVKHHGIQDNPGFRASLEGALRRVAGPHSKSLLAESAPPGERATLAPRKYELPNLESLRLLDRQARDQSLRHCYDQIASWAPERRFPLIETVRTLLAEELACFNICLKLLKSCKALPTSREAELAWDTADVSLREWSLQTLLGTTERATWFRLLESCCPTNALGTFAYCRGSAVRKRLIGYGLRRGWFSSILSLAYGGQVSWILELRNVWEKLYSFRPPTENLLRAWRDASGLAKSELLNWLGGSEACQSRSRESEKRIRALLRSKSPGDRQYAAELLIHWGGSANRRAVLESLLERNLPFGSPNLRLNYLEFQRLLLNRKNLDWSEQVKYLILNSHVPPAVKVRALLQFRSPETLATEGYVRSFRDFGTELVWREIKDVLTFQDLSCLELLPPTSNLPPSMVEKLEDRDQETALAYLRMLQTWHRPLEGKGLAEALASHVRSGLEPEIALRVLCDMRRWNHPKSAGKLLALLEEFEKQRVSKKLVSELRKRILARLSFHPQIRHLWSDLSEPKMIEEATLHCLKEPETVEELPPLLRKQVLKRAFSYTGSRNVEFAIGAMRVIAFNDPPQAAEVLQEALLHPCSRVRFFAHRQLKRTLSKSKYLRATSVLLKDDNPSMRKRAIRVLSYGRYEPAIDKIVDLLWDRKGKVGRVARDGLLRLGNASLPILRKRSAQVRPDRRKDVVSIIDEISRQPATL